MRNLLQLMADNRAVKGARRFEVVNGTAADVATVYLYDTIVSSKLEAEYWGGVAAEDFVRALNAITAPRIDLRINSPGGDVFAARTMEQAIRAHTSTIVAHVDGYAASAASFVAIACDEVEIADGGFFMVHKSWALAMGNADDLIEMAALLEQVDATLVATYVRETGLPADDVRALLAAETWLGAEEAVAKGFADRIAQADDKVAASARVAWNVAALNPPNGLATEIAALLSNAAEAMKPAAAPKAPAPAVPRAAMTNEMEGDCVCPICSAPLLMSMSVTCELETTADETAEDAAGGTMDAEALAVKASRETAARLLAHLEKIAA